MTIIVLEEKKNIATQSSLKVSNFHPLLLARKKRRTLFFSNFVFELMTLGEMGTKRFRFFYIILYNDVNYLKIKQS